MKLIFCPECHDVRRLLWGGEPTKCLCGASGGKYVDGINAEITGKAIPLGFANRSFVYALKNRPLAGLGIMFEAFVIPQSCPTVKQN